MHIVFFLLQLFVEKKQTFCANHMIVVNVKRLKIVTIHFCRVALWTKLRQLLAVLFSHTIGESS
jgi:hypothetical protein